MKYFSKKNSDIFLTPNFIWLLGMMVGFGFFFIGMPKYGDDYWYMEPLRSWFESQGVEYPEDGGNILRYGFPWPGVKYAWKFHWLYDNTRFCNMTVVLCLLFPKWVGSGLSLLGWILAVWGSFRIAGVDWRRSAEVPVAIACWVFLLPWHDMMGSEVYQFNYVLTSGMAILWFIWLRRALSKENRSKWYMILFAFATFLLGGWQEAFSVPLLVGVIAILPAIEKRKRGLIWCALAGLVLGVAWICAAPRYAGIFAREIVPGPEKNFGTLALILSMHPAFWLMAIVCIWGGLHRGFRQYWDNLTLRFLLVSCVCSLLMGWFTKGVARAGWWCDLSAVILILSILKRGWGKWWEHYRPVSVIIAAVLLALSGIRLGYGAVWSLRLREMQRESVEHYLSDPYAPQYIDIPSVADAPLVSAQYPCIGFNLLCDDDIHEYYEGKYPGSRYLQIPSTLRNLTSASGERVEGDASVRKIGGWLVAPAKVVAPERCKRALNGELMENDVVCGAGSLIYDFKYFTIKDPSGFILMRSEADGKIYAIIIPAFPWTYTCYLPLRSVNLAENESKNRK